MYSTYTTIYYLVYDVLDICLPSCTATYTALYILPFLSCPIPIYTALYILPYLYYPMVTTLYILPYIHCPMYVLPYMHYHSHTALHTLLYVLYSIYRLPCYIYCTTYTTVYAHSICITPYVLPHVHGPVYTTPYTLPYIHNPMYTALCMLLYTYYTVCTAIYLWPLIHDPIYTTLYTLPYIHSMCPYICIGHVYTALYSRVVLSSLTEKASPTKRNLDRRLFRRVLITVRRVLTVMSPITDVFAATCM